MARVSVTIAGKTFRMACDDGQERHLQSLAAQLDDAIRGLRATFGEIGDQRLTVMAAITFADGLSEVRRQVSRLEDELLAMRDVMAAAQSEITARETAAAQAVTAAADRIAASAARLNAGTLDA